MVPEDYFSLKISDLKKFIRYCDDSDVVVFKSKNDFVFEGYGIEINENGLILSFNSTPSYSDKCGVFEEYEPYDWSSIDKDFTFLEWMVFKVNDYLIKESDFVEFYNVDDVLMGRLSFFDGFFVKDNNLCILKDSDVCSCIDVGGCSYIVDLELVYYMRFCCN